MATTTTLYRLVGQGELDLIAASGFKSFPPRFPEQPIFYPVLTKNMLSRLLATGTQKTSVPDLQVTSWSSMLKVTIATLTHARRKSGKALRRQSRRSRTHRARQEMSIGKFYGGGQTVT